MLWSRMQPSSNQECSNSHRDAVERVVSPRRHHRQYLSHHIENVPAIGGWHVVRSQE